MTTGSLSPLPLPSVTMCQHCLRCVVARLESSNCEADFPSPRVPRDFVRVPRDFVGVPRAFVRVPRDFVRVPRDFVRVPRDFVRVPRAFLFQSAERG